MADRIELVKVTFSGLTLLVTASAIYFGLQQIVELHRALDSQAYSYIQQNLAKMDAVFISNPEMRLYFFEDADWPEATDGNRTLRSKISAVGEATLDTLDFFLAQYGHLQLKNYGLASWQNYLADSFSHSHVLCDVLRQHHREYGRTLRAIATEAGCKDIPQD